MLTYVPLAVLRPESTWRIVEVSYIALHRFKESGVVGNNEEIHRP